MINFKIKMASDQEWSRYLILMAIISAIEGGVAAVLGIIVINIFFNINLVVTWQTWKKKR